ncbi:MAG TPA: DNA-processing protein DprA, partial [Abditibacteriaceae bacterium]|nr:DNA-processing protein DprA [Abditibacteriaceae bacterium]
LRLAFVGLPAGRCRQALQQWRQPAALLAAAQSGREAELLATPGITPVTVERLCDAATRDITKGMAAMAEREIRLVLETDGDYPAALRSIADPPLYLFVRGTVEARDETAIAIVGTRHATEYGRSVAGKLATELSHRGITIVSGLARGIDTAAHQGALAAGGRTLAVCGCGLDINYPVENKNLAQQIAQSGAALSEFPPTVQPESWHFPARNRIISGLSLGVIVVEAGERSGALITSDFALEQGREVFAVPGNIFKQQSRGAHALIKQGATLVESADDIITALNNRALPFAQLEEAEQAAKSTPPTVRPDLSAVENRVYLALEADPRHIDDLAAAANMGAAEVNATLVMLELKGVARPLPGGMFSRTE